MALCPECGEPLKRGKCECGFVAAHVASFKVPPKLCSWNGCDAPAVIVQVEVEQEGKIRRVIASRVMTKGKCHDGIRFVCWVARCARHWHVEQDARRLDWRERAIQEFQSEHPEFAVVPRTDQECRDAIAMAKAFLCAGKFESEAAHRERLQAQINELRQREPGDDDEPLNAPRP